MAAKDVATIDIAIGIAVIIIGIIIYVIRYLFKKNKKERKRLENRNEILALETIGPPKKTAADHLEEIKESTQKFLRPIKEIVTPGDSNSNSSSLVFSSSPVKEKKSSETFKSRSISLQASTSDPRFEPKVRPLKNLSTRSREKMPSLPPPPSLLESQDDDDIEIDSIDPIQNSSLYMLPSNKSELTHPPPLSSNIQVPFRAQSNLRTNSAMSFQSTSVSSQASSDVFSGMTSLQDDFDSEMPEQEQRHFIRPNYYNKETNDYTNFQPVQNTKPIQKFKKGKRIVRESQDDEIDDF